MAYWDWKIKAIIQIRKKKNRNGKEQIIPKEKKNNRKFRYLNFNIQHSQVEPEYNEYTHICLGTGSSTQVRENARHGK